MRPKRKVFTLFPRKDRLPCEEHLPFRERLSHKERLTIQRASRDAPGFSTNYLISPERDETFPWTLFTKDKVAPKQK